MSDSGFTTPAIADLISGAQANLNARLAGADSRLRRSTLGVLATVWAGGDYALYGYLNYISDQVLPDTQDDDHLQRYATIYGLQAAAANPASGVATCPAESSTPGIDVPAGTLFQALDGTEYVTLVDVQIDGTGAGAVTLQASEPGSASTQAAGVAVELVSPIAGVADSWTVGVDGLAGGTDAQTSPELLGDVEDRLQQPAAGGDLDDYAKWAMAAGVGATRAWTYRGWMGLGTVGVTFLCDGRENPQPLPADVVAVQAYIDSVCPVTAEAVVFAPIVDQVALTIQLAPNTAGTQAAVAAELQALFLREAAPGAGPLRSHLDEAIAIAAGVSDHSVLQPAAGNVLSAPGHLATVGVLTWAG